jgi:hypothetical protein
MIHIERKRKTSNVPEPSREENIYVIRTKEDTDGIYEIITMI